MYCHMYALPDDDENFTANHTNSMQYKYQQVLMNHTHMSFVNNASGLVCSTTQWLSAMQRMNFIMVLGNRIAATKTKEKLLFWAMSLAMIAKLKRSQLLIKGAKTYFVLMSACLLLRYSEAEI